MTVVIISFWISLVILFFCYIGYGLLLFALNRLKRLFARPGKAIVPGEWPPVTMIVAAYNEASVLEEKLENTWNIDYPEGRLKIIFVTDGSTDGSESLVSKYPDILLAHQQEREGKLAAITRVMHHVKTPFVIFSDANTMLNQDCIKKMIVHYADPVTGGVAGEKKIRRIRERSAIGEAEGLYWRYESFMKKQDADFYTVVGAAGELFSIRTALFDPPEKNLLLDDFVISMKVCLKGYKIKYEPGAFATELPSASLEEETKRKIRISAGAYQSIGYLKECLNFFKRPLLCFQYVSRRLLRWIVCPLMLIFLLATNLGIVCTSSSSSFYSWFLYGQLLFYASAVAGWILVRSGKYIGILVTPFYFLFMNYCLVRGFFRFLKKDQTVLWERSVREIAR
jgi:biofilm PGA synthesis N-glycosyltransferase PgaC